MEDDCRRITMLCRSETFALQQLLCVHGATAKPYLSLLLLLIPTLKPLNPVYQALHFQRSEDTPLTAESFLLKMETSFGPHDTTHTANLRSLLALPLVRFGRVFACLRLPRLSI